MNPRALATCRTAVFVVLAVAAAPRMTPAQPLEHLFRSGDDGYQCFRIPAIVTTNTGALLAFADGRRNGCTDTGDIDLVLKRSENGGRWWARQTVVHEGPSAYSHLITLPNGNLAILFEGGASSPYEGIAFRELPIQRFERSRPPAPGETPYEQSLEIRTSRVPHAGNGVFTKARIPKGAYLGAYTGEFITEDEFLRRSAANRWRYMMGLLDCARPHSKGLGTIDGIDGNVFTRMNYAPPEFQNVRFEKICEAPFVKIVALRDIAAGEEL